METIEAGAGPKEKTAKQSVIRESEIGSKKVFLRRRVVESHLPKEVRENAVSKLASVFKDRQPLRGFPVGSPDEKKYLNGLLDVGPESLDWEKNVRSFWQELRIPVGFTGTPLEIGVDDIGEPLSIEDFVKYSWIKRHPLVANSEAEMLKNPNLRFYILDPAKEGQKKNANVQTAKLADREFIKMSDNAVRMKNVLQVLGKGKLETTSAEAIENMLYDIKQADPKRFLEAATDPDIDIRAEIASFISAGTIVKFGNSLVHGNDTIANSEEESIVFWKNAKNSGLLNIMRTKYKEQIR